MRFLSTSKVAGFFFKGALLATFLGCSVMSRSANAQTVDHSAGFANSSDLNVAQTANNGITWNVVNPNYLQMTDMQDPANSWPCEASTVFTNKQVDIRRFTNSFTFSIQGQSRGWMADGITFTIQNAPAGTTFPGQPGGSLGYQGIPNSVAVKFDVYQNWPDPSDNTTGIFTNGEAPFGGYDLYQTPIDLGSGDLMQADMVYDNAVLTVRITDLVTNQSTTNKYSIDIAQTIGSTSAYVGFTGADGAAVSNTQIFTWKYVSSQNAPGILSIIPASNWIAGGINTTGTVSISEPLKTDTKITLASSNPAVKLPASVVVPSGQLTASFPITTSAVSSTQHVEISGTLNSTTVYGTIQVHADGIASLTIKGNDAPAGSVQTGVVTLQTPAPSDTVVTLVSNNPKVANVPASITIPKGKISQDFPINLGGVTAETTVDLTATANGFSAGTSISVRPLKLTKLTLSATPVLGGAALTGTVTIELPAPVGGMLIDLGSQKSYATVPNTVLIPAGQTSVKFPINTTGISQTDETDINAWTATNGVTAELTVRAPAITLLTVTPTVKAGQQAQGTITLEAPAPAAGEEVWIVSSNTGVATVIGSIVIPAGAKSANFVVNTRTAPSAATALITASTPDSMKSVTISVTK